LISFRYVNVFVNILFQSVKKLDNEGENQSDASGGGGTSDDDDGSGGGGGGNDEIDEDESVDMMEDDTHSWFV